MNKVRRVNDYQAPQFPKWQEPQGPVGFIVGALLWGLMLLAFLFFFYVQLFSLNTKYLLSLFTPKTIHIPFWFSILIVVFLFPVSLGIVLIGTLIKLLRD